MRFSTSKTVRIFVSRSNHFRVMVAIIGLFCLTQDVRSQTHGEAPLVTGNRFMLNLSGAELVIHGARQKAESLNLKVNIAVVDAGGHLLSFARMDGARPASAYTALTKAVTAATFRQATGPILADGEPDILLNLSLQNAALASGGKLTTLKGGVPIEYEGQVIGAVGIGGATGEQDAELARAGIQTLLDKLKSPK